MLSYMISPKLSMSSALRQKIRSPVGDTTLSFNFFLFNILQSPIYFDYPSGVQIIFYTESIHTKSG